MWEVAFDEVPSCTSRHQSTALFSYKSGLAQSSGFLSPIMFVHQVFGSVPVTKGSATAGGGCRTVHIQDYENLPYFLI